MNASTRERLNPTAATVVEFCRFIRARGVPVGVQQTLAALEVTRFVDAGDWQILADALRASLCSSKEEWDRFEQLFQAFWKIAGMPAEEDLRPALPRTVTPSDKTSVLIGPSGVVDSSSEREGKLVSGASARERLKNVDFSEVPQHDLAELEQLSLRLLRRMSQRISRRLRRDDRGHRVDVRRTIRRNISRGGELMTLACKGRKRQNSRLVIFLDVSGSMNLYSLFLVRFAYALQKHGTQVNTFLFSTGLADITGALRTARFSDALKQLGRVSAGWSGGTKIGGSLREFNRRQGRRLLSRDTVFIILSDGWDTGEPEVLSAELRFLRRLVHKVIWLNPLLGLADYQPITRGMSAALPHVDVFAPAHSLRSLLALEKYL